LQPKFQRLSQFSILPVPSDIYVSTDKLNPATDASSLKEDEARFFPLAKKDMEQVMY
jgi:hypothetical protein